MRIPDPLELLERAQEREIDKIRAIDGVDCYPCIKCGRMTDIDTMLPADEQGIYLACDREDCTDVELEQQACCAQ